MADVIHSTLKGSDLFFKFPDSLGKFKILPVEEEISGCGRSYDIVYQLRIHIFSLRRTGVIITKQRHTITDKAIREKCVFPFVTGHELSAFFLGEFTARVILFRHIRTQQETPAEEFLLCIRQALDLIDKRF